MAKSSISYYKNKLKIYLSQLNSVDVFTINDYVTRHKSIDLQLDLLSKIQPLLRSVSIDSENRDKEGMFSELRSYNKHIEYLKKYTDDYSQEHIAFLNLEVPEDDRIDLAIIMQSETKKQLEIINKITAFDKFVEELSRPPSLKGKDLKAKNNYESLSLADLRLI